MLAIEIIFWISLGLIFFALMGYPLLCLILAAFFPKNVKKKPITPTVTFMIAAYNEEKVIGEKIRQTLQLDYPPEKMEIMVVSDGSTDQTDDMVEQYKDQNVVLYRVEGRRGKTAALNEAVKKAKGEILIFSDATGSFSQNSIREIVANFNDSRVGCVTGRVAYRYKKDMNSKGFKIYQKFAVAVRRAESKFGSQTSVSGSIHAVRKSLFRPSPPEYSLDVIDAVNTVAQDYRVLYEDNAVSWEESRTNWEDEFRCRVRMSIRNTSKIAYVLRKLFQSGKIVYALQMVSHKVLRWCLWLLLLLVFVTNGILVGKGQVFLALFVAQILFYLIALVGFAAEKHQIKLPLVSVIGFFVLTNVAMAVGAIRSSIGSRMPKWEPVR